MAQIEQAENQLIKSIDFQLVFYNIAKILAKIKVFAQICDKIRAQSSLPVSKLTISSSGKTARWSSIPTQI
ncbi:hypothetical protein [Muribaculum intestinale]|uniref:hypothetical protein n=1 Tax=Muribaculum intestinale TaxID=1796646 RepID=UPI001B30E05D|nr:hypothetical protein [Muribaculum intestinale]